MAKTKRLNLRITDEEFLQLKALSEKAGVTLTKYLIHSGLNKEITPQFDLQIMAQLKHIGGNLNQITRRFNAIKPEEFERFSPKINQALEKVIAMLNLQIR